jgi:hypothetical protein
MPGVADYVKGIPASTPPKSAEGREIALRTLLELESSPLGTKRGENFGVAANYVEPPARIYVRNWSATVERKEILVAVSTRRGAEEALNVDKDLRNIYNVDTLYRTVEQGRDMNRYRKRIHPVIFKIQVGQKTRFIPPAKDASEPPPKVEVPEGAWDLFLGNYERMRGIVRDFRGDVKRSGDATVIGEETSRWNLYWSRRHNPVMSYTDDGDTVDRKNQFGFLEFIRETVEPMQEMLDKEYLTALDLVESA